MIRSLVNGKEEGMRIPRVYGGEEECMKERKNEGIEERKNG